MWPFTKPKPVPCPVNLEGLIQLAGAKQLAINEQSSIELIFFIRGTDTWFRLRRGMYGGNYQLEHHLRKRNEHPALVPGCDPDALVRLWDALENKPTPKPDPSPLINEQINRALHAHYDALIAQGGS